VRARDEQKTVDLTSNLPQKERKNKEKGKERKGRRGGKKNF
jgi:hypothetical protein